MAGSGLLPLRFRVEGRTREAARKLKGPAPGAHDIAANPEKKKAFINDIMRALYASKIVSYAQGYHAHARSGEGTQMNLNYGGSR